MADVVVHGGGIFGLCVAFVCLGRGARVCVVDPAGPGGEASGGPVGALAPHTPENWNPKKAFQRDSLLMAEAFWADVAATGGTDPGYARAGRLQPIDDADARDLALARAEGAAALWLGQARWEVVDAESAGDWAPTTATGLLIRDTLSGRLHPRRACAALAAAIAARGGTILREAPDAAFGAQVWATGAAGLAALSEELGRPVGVAVKGQAALLGLDRRTAPQIFTDGIHIVPHADGTVAIGSTTERAFDDPAATDARLDDVIRRARVVCPALAGAPVVARWAGLRPRARSRAPMLGPHPRRAGVFIANGGFKIGFGMAPKVGEVMADLVLEGRDTIPEGFRVDDNL